MSASWSLRSYGSPSFAMVQDHYSGMTPAGLFTSGIYTMSAEVRVNRLPEMVAGLTERHSFFSLAYNQLSFWLAVFEVGVTPDGRLAAMTKCSVTNKYGAAGMLVPDGTWHDVDVVCDVGAGTTDLILDGVTLLSHAGTPANLVGPPGKPLRLMLFNGRDGIANGDISLRRVFGAATDGSNPAHGFEYQFTEKRGPSISPVTPSGMADFPAVDFTLTAGRFPSVSSPGHNVGYDHFAWECNTPYTKRAKPATVFLKTRVA